ncbi:MAG: molybdopterin oxidoreductase [Dehalococcoidia bacterium]|nr:polysulfide reductase NrfD [Chloroflexota bacterium]MXY45046.1 molybdopterin oxidoreductase [Dehalococcoidia bacterium]MYB48977.1 molybdopterin oxidoreductase [Dehalococcoidia bacterium]MYD51336.1 molybdopterin oxidoreductase [Dehalococcoidia bacterium]
MQEHVQLTQKQINDDLLSSVLKTPRWWWPSVIVTGIIFLTGMGAFGYMLNQGVGVTGLNRPVFWGAYMVNFVFFIGISHAGIMISAILRLTQAEWRRPVTRAAEVLTVFSLMSALMAAPLVHVGRPWRADLWVFPYDFARGIWINIRSPFIWDPSAVMTYLTASSLFVFIALIPDLAVIRDRATGYTRKLYAVLAMGWRGTPRQWKLQAVAGILLSALVLPVFVSVHSIVSWDFAVQIGPEAWHSTIFAPYFIIGAIHSGVSAVATLMVIMVWLWGWDKYLKPDHLDAIGRLLIIVATTWFFFFFLEWVFALYTLEDAELAMRDLQVFQWPWSALFIVFLITAYFIPVPMWLFKSVRRSYFWMFVTTILVNIGMWLERFLIIVPGTMRRSEFIFDWGSYHPSIIEILMVIMTFAWVVLGMLVFTKLFPLIPLFDVKEAMVGRDEIRIGRRVVPASIRE